MQISIHKAKRIAFRICRTYNRCCETPNYYEFYTEGDYRQKPIYVSKITGKPDDHSHFFQDFFHDFSLRLYEITKDNEAVIHEYAYFYYPEKRAVTKSDGCTFFDAERGFIFDFDGDVFFDEQRNRMRDHFCISGEEAFAIVNSKDYRYLFFGRHMNKKDIDYFERLHMPYRLLPKNDT